MRSCLRDNGATGTTARAALEEAQRQAIFEVSVATSRTVRIRGDVAQVSIMKASSNRRFVAAATAACTAGILARGLVALAEESTALSQNRISPPDSSARAIDRVYSSPGPIDLDGRAYRLEGEQRKREGDGPRHLAKKSKKPGANETQENDRIGDLRRSLTSKNKGKEEYSMIETRYARKGSNKKKRNNRNRPNTKANFNRLNKKKGGGRGNRFANAHRNNYGDWCECDFDDDWGRHDDDDYDDDWSKPSWMTGLVTIDENVRRLAPWGGKSAKRGKSKWGKSHKRGKSGGNNRGWNNRGWNNRGGKRKCKCPPSDR